MARAKEAQQNNEKSTGLTRRESTGPMSWSPWSSGPFSMMDRFAEEMDRLFENFGVGRSGLMSRHWGQQQMWTPQIEAFEHEGQFIVRADLPGMNKDNVKVEITDNVLTLQGERKQEHEENRQGFHRSERSYGSFFRSIPLPEGVNSEEAKASFRDGVLEITMPAPQREERRRQIEITT